MLLLKIYILAFLAVWIAAVVVAYGYGRVGRRVSKFRKFASPDAALPPLSIVIPAHNQAAALRRHLPAILSQDYDLFEVIVVNIASTDDTSSVLERLELQYANLHHTFTPLSARDISLERLALTLGFRAAAYDWVVLTRPDCEPTSSDWLTRIGETIAAPKNNPQSPHLGGEPDIVVCLARYAHNRYRWIGQKSSFLRLWTDLSNVSHVLGGHAAMQADGCNLAYRRSFFIENGGFSGHQNLKLGAAELLVNFNSTRSNTALLLAPSAHIVQEPVSDEHAWHSQRLFDCETRRHRRHAWLYRAVECMRLALPWLLLAMVVAGATLPFVAYDDASAGYATPMMVIVGVLTLLYTGLKLSCFNLSARALGYRPSYLTFLYFELALPFWKLADALRHRRASRNEFRKKFV